MKRVLRSCAAVGLFALSLFAFGLSARDGFGPFVQAANAAEAGAAGEFTQIEVASYALGRNLVAVILEDGYELDEAMLVQGIRDVLNGRESPFGLEQLQEALGVLQEERDRRLRREAAAWNLAYANAFLEANKEREGVHVTESGLQYEIIRPGSGGTPGASDVVRVHYRGTFGDGLEFDSSYRRGVPSVFAVSDVILGWAEALQRMAVGAVWQIYVPPHLAYGEEGAGPIGPNELLIFDIELLGIAAEAE